MRALAEFLLSFQWFQDALRSLGWVPESVDKAGGPGPWRPPQ